MAETVIYQIFPDRFRRSGRVDEQRLMALKPWGVANFSPLLIGVLFDTVSLFRRCRGRWIESIWFGIALKL